MSDERIVWVRQEWNEAGYRYDLVGIYEREVDALADAGGGELIEPMALERSREDADRAKE